MPRPRIQSRRSDEELESEADIDLSDGEVACLNSDRRIFLCGSIDEDKLAPFMVALRALDSEPGKASPITIVLSSEGGSENAGYAMYDAIRACRNPVIIEGYGAVMSIAALVLQAGSSRLLSPESRFMIHNGTIGLGRLDQRTLVSVGKETARNNKRYYRVLAEHSGLSQKKVEQYCDRETYLSAEQAVGLGFADAIIQPATANSARSRKKG